MDYIIFTGGTIKHKFMFFYCILFHKIPSTIIFRFVLVVKTWITEMQDEVEGREGTEQFHTRCVTCWTLNNFMRTTKLVFF